MLVVGYVAGRNSFRDQILFKNKRHWKICFVNFDNRDAFFWNAIVLFFSCFFFSLNKFNYFCTKILLNGTMNTNVANVICNHYFNN